MHTDEYEISLARELRVCEKKVEEIKNTLLKLERKYGKKTEAFVETFRDGKMSGQHDDFLVWLKEYGILKKWEALRDQYAELLHRMKI